MSRMVEPSSNGHASSQSRGTRSTSASPRDRGVIEALERPQHGTFTFNDLSKLGITARLEASTFLLGLGSTGSDTVHQIIELITRELGRVPQSLDYFLIDAASARPGVDPSHFFQMALDGCGTDPKEGHREFCQHYAHLRSAIMSLVLGLFAARDDFSPALGARSFTNFWLFAGQGGTSGGAMHPAITLLHDVATERHIQEPRIHVSLIGPEISLRDITRTVTRKQEQVVRDTFAVNVAKLSSDFKESSCTQTRHDGTTFDRMTPYRIYALDCNDQSNGEAEFATVPDFVQSMAHSYFLRIMTQSGIDLMDQFCNLDKLNDTGRRNL